MRLIELRALFGNTVRFAIDVNDRDANGIGVRCAVGAYWACGCTATGSSFSAMRCAMCETHRNGAAGALVLERSGAPPDSIRAT